MSIRRLNADVSSRLKSHEYVVSITAIVRELIHNSVDADASNVIINVDIDKFFVEAQDNGFGMNPGDLNLLGARNMSSKIEFLQQLSTIDTYGFRGEAIHMILQCSRMKVISKSRKCNGIWSREFPFPVHVMDANEIGLIKYGDSGTIVRISDLFHNFPVRREMLRKKPLPEIISAIRAEVLTVLVKRPDLKISVFVNHRLCAQSSSIDQPETIPNQLTRCFRNVYGEIIPLGQFRYVSAAFKSHFVKGIVSSHPRATKDFQYIIINGRPLDDPRFYSAVNKLFQSTKYAERNWNSYTVKSVGSPYSGYPLFIVTCEAPSQISDLIQDPAKRIVQAESLKILYPLILNAMISFLKHIGYEPALEATIVENPSLYESENFWASTKKVPVSPKPATTHIVDNRVSKSQVSKMLKVLRAPVKENAIISKLLENTKGIPKGSDQHSLFNRDSEFDIRSLDLSGTESSYLKKHTINELKLFKSQVRKFRVIKQVDRKFILVSSGQVILILDQHACHERITVEKMLKETISNFMNNTIEYTDVCVKINISSEEANWFHEFKPEFAKWGIFLTLNYSNSGVPILELLKVPKFFNDKIKLDDAFLKSALLQHIYDLKSNLRRKVSYFFDNERSISKWWTVIPHMPRVYIEIINSKSCRSAIMFGTTLSKPECEILVSDLSKCQWPFQCAHGRPSIVPIIELSDPLFRVNSKDYDIT
ncbi:unnamed protein product [Kluyveromyces dobzhanskii CBS 2104]|uniref:WGS project CCBQ000000000 data, contig 00099 n=1 Tax=Kluyveromyces dobzhanskii CBS 2104 TaxID=1427455 RepID=A0A0A8L2S0_9SACH|nr:unnamed protein product [Kluyveromyces dobzhanskii CBS 2104]